MKCYWQAMPSYIQKTKPPIPAAAEMGGFVLVRRSQVLVTQKILRLRESNESRNLLFITHPLPPHLSVCFFTIESRILRNRSYSLEADFSFPESQRFRTPLQNKRCEGLLPSKMFVNSLNFTIKTDMIVRNVRRCGYDLVRRR